MLGHGGRSAGSYLADPTSPIPSHCAVNMYFIPGLGCSTVIAPEAAALQAAQILSLQDHMIWSRLRARQLNAVLSLKAADKKARDDK